MALIKAGKYVGTDFLYITNVRGSDCSGSHGDNNRAYTISSIAAEEIIFSQGVHLFPGVDYTKSNSATASTYTFVNKVYDGFYIRVYWWTS